MTALLQKPADLLREAKALIAVPDHWCQGVLYRDAKGNAVPRFKEAARYCAIGACLATGADTDLLEAALPDSYPTRSIGDYNDSRTHRTILRLFDRAIEIAESSR